MTDEPVDIAGIGSAAVLGELLGDRVPTVSSITDAALDLALAVIASSTAPTP